MNEPLKAHKLPLEHYIPEDMDLKFANNITIQHTEHEFIIGFYQVDPPLVLGPLEERQKKVKEIDSVRAKCIARIAVPAGRMKEFIQTLQENLESYQGSEQAQDKTRWVRGPAE